MSGTTMYWAGYYQVEPPQAFPGKTSTGLGEYFGRRKIPQMQALQDANQPASQGTRGTALCQQGQKVKKQWKDTVDSVLALRQQLTAYVEQLETRLVLHVHDMGCRLTLTQPKILILLLYSVKLV